MRLSVTNENGVTIVGMSGRFDSAVTSEIRERLSQLMGAGVNRMLLNLSRVEHISSAGFWALLALAREMEARRGSLALYGVSEEVKRLFDLSGFAGEFNICPTRELGLDAVRDSANSTGRRG